MQSFVTLLLSLLISTGAFAGGRIEGVVTDTKTGSPIIGATILVKGTTSGAATDLDGRFTISVDPGTYTLNVKYIGYGAKDVSDVVVTEGGTTSINVNIKEAGKSTQLGEVVVRSSLKKENINSMILLQKTTNTVAQVVSAEAIRRSPDRNTGEVLKRVSGASIQEGKYLVVRGLADRYNAAMLNGALLTSTEPDRKTFSFDLFPSNIVDNIVINKAAVPELPGEFAGGLVQINTRDIPSENFATLQLGSGGNTQTFGKPFLSNNVGGRDWLGIDGGGRKMPANFAGSGEQFNNSEANRRAEYTRLFPNNWALSNSSAPINIGGQATAGYSHKLGKGTLGFIGSLNYSKNNRRSDNDRLLFNQPGDRAYAYFDQRYSQDVTWGGLGNIAYSIGKSKFSWKNLYNVTTNNAVTVREGINYANGPFNVRSSELAFVTNSIFSTQLAGEHVITSLDGLKAKWNLSYSNLKQNTPDLRRLSYQTATVEDHDYVANIPDQNSSLGSSGRFFSDLNDNVYGASGDLSKSFRILGVQQAVKIGGLFQKRDRDFAPRALGYVLSRQDTNITKGIIHQPMSTIFAPGNLASDKLLLDESTKPTDPYKAGSILGAGYIQLDNQFLDRFQLSWGARMESYYQEVSYNDGYSPLKVDTIITDILPSANLKYSLTDKMNLRVSGSQTVIRPEFREIAPFSFYNFDLMAVESGNPLLKRTKVTNLDLRYEIYPAPGEFATIGGFYKKFSDPIERYYNSTGGGSIELLYNNAMGASSYGVEAEFRKSLGFLQKDASENGLLRNLFVFANGAVINNEVNFGSSSRLQTRPMQGQSNYVVNAGIQAEIQKTGTQASVLVNRIGRRIFLIGDQGTQPDIWEAPRTLLDFQVTQRFAQNAEFKLSISDLLNQYQNFYEDVNRNGKYDGGGSADFLRIRSRYGRNISISVAYKLGAKPRAPKAVTIP